MSAGPWWDFSSRVSLATHVFSVVAFAGTAIWTGSAVFVVYVTVLALLYLWGAYVDEKTIIAQRQEIERLQESVRTLKRDAEAAQMEAYYESLINSEDHVRTMLREDDYPVEYWYRNKYGRVFWSEKELDEELEKARRHPPIDC